MLAQTTLLHLARDYAERKVKERPSLKAVVLTGSVARGEPALGEAADLDIILIDDFIPDPSHEIVRLSDNVFVDAVFVRAADYADRKSLRAHHFIAPALNEALSLHDPRHYFDILQAAIRAPYNRPDNIYARARSALATAQRSIDRFSQRREDAPLADPTLDDLEEYRQALYQAGQSIILLSGQPGDTVGARKFMARYEAAARRHNPELYPLFLAAFGVGNLTPASFDIYLPEWSTLYKIANGQGAVEPLIHPARRGYYERGFHALIAEGHALNTLWLFEHTLATCVRHLDPVPDIWLGYLYSAGKSTGAEFAERTHHAEQLVALTDTALTAWAKKENVE